MFYVLDVVGSLICTFNAKEDYKTIFHLLYNCQEQHGLFSWGRFDMFMICKDQIAQVSQTSQYVTQEIEIFIFLL